MRKVISVRTDPLGKWAIESGQRTFKFLKKEYDFERGDAITFHCRMNGMDVLVQGIYEVTKTDYGREGPCALISFRRIKDYEYK